MHYVLALISNFREVTSRVYLYKADVFGILIIHPLCELSTGDLRKENE